MWQKTRSGRWESKIYGGRLNNTTLENSSAKHMNKLNWGKSIPGKRHSKHTSQTSSVYCLFNTCWWSFARVSIISWLKLYHWIIFTKKRRWCHKSECDVALSARNPPQVIRLFCETNHDSTVVRPSACQTPGHVPHTHLSSAPAVTQEQLSWSCQRTINKYSTTEISFQYWWIHVASLTL